MGAKWVKGESDKPIGRAIVYSGKSKLAGLATEYTLFRAVCTSLADLIILPIMKDAIALTLHNPGTIPRALELIVSNAREAMALNADVINAGNFGNDIQVRQAIETQAEQYDSLYKRPSSIGHYTEFEQREIVELIQKQAESTAKLYQTASSLEADEKLKQLQDADKKLRQTFDFYKGASFINDVFKLFKYAHDKCNNYDRTYAKLIAEKIHAMIFKNDKTAGAIERKIKEYEMRLK